MNFSNTMANTTVNREGLELLTNSSFYTDSSGFSPGPPAGGLRHFGNFAQGLDQLSGSPVSGSSSSPPPAPLGGLRAFGNFSRGLNEISGESFGQSEGNSPIPGCVEACANALSGGNSLGVRSSISAPLMGQTMPSQGQSLPLPPRPAAAEHARRHASAPQPHVHTIDLTPDANNPSFANVILNFNYGLGADWGQAKRLPGQQYGVSADSMDVTPSFKLHPDLHSTPMHPVDPNKTPSSLFDPTPPSPGFMISQPIKHLFDSRLLGPDESLNIPSANFKSLVCEPTPDVHLPTERKAMDTTFNMDTCSCKPILPSRVVDKTFTRPSEKTYSVQGNTTYVIPKDKTFTVPNKTTTPDQDLSSSFKPPAASSPLQDTANSMLAMVDSMSMQERQSTMDGLRSFQQKRRKILSKKA